MKIVEKRIADLVGSEHNARKLSDADRAHLRESLQRFGFVDPIIVNVREGRRNVIVGGHQRVEVWARLGHETVPAVEVDLDPERERELNVRLNRNVGEWDWQKLGAQFTTEELQEWGFDENETKLLGVDFISDPGLSSAGSSYEYIGKSLCFRIGKFAAYLTGEEVYGQAVTMWERIGEIVDQDDQTALNALGRELIKVVFASYENLLLQGQQSFQGEAEGRHEREDDDLHV